MNFVWNCSQFLFGGGGNFIFQIEDGDTFFKENSLFCFLLLFIAWFHTDFSHKFVTLLANRLTISDWIKVESVSCQTNGSSINFYEVDFSQQPDDL